MTDTEQTEIAEVKEGNGHDLPQTTDEASGLLSVIERVASDPNADVNKLEKMLDMQERVIKRQAELAFNEAMTRLQPKLPTVEKLGKTDKSAYARYEDIERKIRPYYTEEGFTVSFDSKMNDNGTVTFYGTLAHKNGHSKTSHITLPADTSGSKNGIQAYGSTVSYAKRYLLVMLLNIITIDEDDDAETAGNEYITEDQLNHLHSLLEQSGADKKRFCEYFKVSGLPYLYMSEYGKAEQMLQNKIKQQGLDQ